MGGMNPGIFMTGMPGGPMGGVPPMMGMGVPGMGAFATNAGGMMGAGLGLGGGGLGGFNGGIGAGGFATSQPSNSVFVGPAF
jgi:hypothetical protein